MRSGSGACRRCRGLWGSPVYLPLVADRPRRMVLLILPPHLQRRAKRACDRWGFALDISFHALVMAMLSPLHGDSPNAYAWMAVP